MKNVINPVPIEVRVEVAGKKSEAVLQAENLELPTTEDMMYYLTHKVNNKKGADGRINMGIKDGKLSSNSVSPYAEKFVENVEDGVLGLVNALTGKRYLTYSSCEGHGFSFRRYVGLAFCDEDIRDYVRDMIVAENIFGVKINYLDSVCNVFAEQVGKTHKIDFDKRKTESLTEEQREWEIINFNIQFHRNYKQYCFMEIVIFEGIPYGDYSFFEGVVVFFKKLIKKWFTEKSTKKLEMLFLSDKFKRYGF